MSQKKFFNASSAAHSGLLQTLEKRFMFDAAAIDTFNKAVDLSDGTNEHEQQEVLSALTANDKVIAAQSLFDALAVERSTPIDYSNVHEVIFIDSRVQDPQELISLVSRNATIEIIDSSKDGVYEIAALLQKYNHLDAIHIISHGAEGKLFLGNTTLDMQTINHYSIQLAAWGGALADTGDILFYGCDVANGEAGSAFLNTLRSMTSADIGASLDATGGTGLGGNWELESHDQVDVDKIITAPDYGHLLNLSYSSLDDRSYTEGDGTTRVDSNMTITGISPEDASHYVNTFFVSVFYASGPQAGSPDASDVLGIASDSDPTALNNISTSGSTVRIGNGAGGTTDIGTYSFLEGTLYISLNPSTLYTDAGLTSLARHITFNNTSDNINTTNRTITFNAAYVDGGPTVSDSMTLSVVAVNDPPTLSATGANPSYTENSATPVNLFSGIVTADTIESGQTFTAMTMTITNATDTDFIKIDDSLVQLLTSGNNATTSVNGLSVIVDSYSEGGTATLHFSGASLSTAQITSIVQSLAYKSTADDFSNTTRVVTITELKDSGGNESLSNLATSTVTITAVNDAPTLTATGVGFLYQEGNSAVTLFTGASTTNAESYSGQTISQLAFTVTNIESGERLTLDGTEFALTNGNSGTTSINGLSYSVSISGSTATITATSSGGLSLASTNSLVNTMAFRTTADHFSDTERVVTITQITDSGSNSSPNSNTSNPNVSVTVTLVPINDEPTLVALPSDPSYTENGTAVTLFNSASTSAVESSQTINRLVLTVSNVATGDRLSFDGYTIALTDGNSGTTTNNAITFSVSISGGVATLTATDNAGGLSTSAINSLVNAIAFSSTADSFTSSSRAITITQIRDSGSGTSPNDNTGTPYISSTMNPLVSNLTIIPVNDAPTTTGFIGTQSVIVGNPVSVSVALSNFSDPDSTLTNSSLSASGLPAGLTLQNGVISGTATSAMVGTHTVIITASDSAASTTLSFSLIISNLPDTQEEKNTQSNTNSSTSSSSSNTNSTNFINSSMTETSSQNSNSTNTTLTDVVEISPVLVQKLNAAISTGSVVAEVKNIISSTTEDPAKIADSLYDFAVKTTQETTSTNLLEDVVSTLVTELKTTEANYNNFIDKFINDSRLTTAQKVAVINRLITSGHAEIAQLLLQKLDAAMDPSILEKTLMQPKNKDINCTPVS